MPKGIRTDKFTSKAGDLQITPAPKTGSKSGTKSGGSGKSTGKKK